MKVGIVGLPNVGKSTLFNCLSNAKAQSANFPFCTIEPNIGIVNVPDNRLAKLEAIVKPQRTVPATVEIVDIAGLVKGASKGEGLGNKFLSNIRECYAIIHLLRCFENDNITHVEGKIDPINDKEIIDTELLLKDLETVDNRFTKITKTVKTGDKESLKEQAVLATIKKELEKGIPIRMLKFSEEENDFVTKLQLLTAKPVLYACNVDESSAKNGNSYVEKVKKIATQEKAKIIFLAAKTESDIAEFTDYEEKQIFLSDLGLEEPLVNVLIRKTYELLSLQTYFTAGEKEVRAWTVPIGSTAVKASSVIHSSFLEKFIRSSVIDYNDFITYLGDETKLREVGKIRTEGKDYVVKDGDVIHFRTNP